MNHLERTASARLAAQHVSECGLGPFSCDECDAAEMALADEDEQMTCEARGDR